MSGKNFVNQFKNTRRLAGLQNRRPLGGQAGQPFGKKVKNSDLSKKKPDRNRRTGATFPSGTTK